MLLPEEGSTSSTAAGALPAPPPAPSGPEAYRGAAPREGKARATARATVSARLLAARLAARTQQDATYAALCLFC